MTSEISIGRVQDTARWAAASRAAESEREDALFHDRFARRFVGQEMDAMNELNRRIGGTWPVVARTVLIDRLLVQATHAGADAVLNLAAGFDTRPYRLVLPRTLTWIDVDHADVIASRKLELDGQSTSCTVEQRALDLSEEAPRRALFDEVGARFQRLIVLTEGLLYYLSDEAALGLARELRALRPQLWVFDLHNRAVVEMVRKRSRGALSGTAEMRFAPERGPLVFEQLGWTIRSAASSAKTAGSLGRLPLFMSLLARLPAPKYGKPGWPWAGVCAAEVTPNVVG